MRLRKLKEVIRLVRAKHYAVLIADSEAEIGWAIDTLRASHPNHNSGGSNNE